MYVYHSVEEFVGYQKIIIIYLYNNNVLLHFVVRLVVGTIIL